MSAIEPGCPNTDYAVLLVAADGSICSNDAVDEAIVFAKSCGSRLYALSVVEVNEEYQAFAPKLVEDAELRAREIVDDIRLKAEKAGVSCESIIRQGDEPYRSIIAEAKRNKADMIIMGSHGRTGLRRLMMGSVTARVIGHAPCKVMVVPLRGEPE